MPETGSNDSQASEVAILLDRIRAGSESAFNELVPLVYEELRGLAHAQRLSWRGDHTLDTTALVHEAYLKLAGTEDPDWESHAHFQSVAARAMRQILIDYARAKRRAKRGGDRVQVTLDHEKLVSPAGDESEQGNTSETKSRERIRKLVALEAALGRLEELDKRQGRIVECRFFGGMTIADTAAALGISPATVKRDRAVAKAWLYHDMQQALGV